MKNLDKTSNNLITISLIINGDEKVVNVRPIETIADVLREKLGLTGTKVMCNEGECGACTILIDGKPVLSCLTLAIECAGKNITTIEGLADRATGELHPLQKSFIAHSGMQCGVCTSGMILTAKALLEENVSPTEAEIRENMAGNLCRCGNYNRIVESVLAAAQNLKEQQKDA